MLLSIKLPSLIDLDIEGVVHLEVGEGIDLKTFLAAIESTDWGAKIVEEGRIKPPFGLIIDGELVLLKSKPDIYFNDKTEIRIIPLLSGG